MAFVNNQLQAPATLEQLQAQLRQLQQTGPGGDRQVGSRSSMLGSAPVVESGVGRFNADQMDLVNRIQRMQQGSGGSGNSTDDMLRQALMERAGAGAGPYDEATRNALMTQASDTAGQVALNARGRIHGSAGDPSVIAANNEADARRLASIQGAQLGINTQANVANYNARGQALGQLAGYEQNQQDFALRQAMANNAANQQVAYNNYRAPQQQQRPAQPQQMGTPQPSAPRNGGLVVRPTAPDMSGWTTQQRQLYTGQQPVAPQQPVGVVRQPQMSPYTTPGVNNAYGGFRSVPLASPGVNNAYRFN